MADGPVVTRPSAQWSDDRPDQVRVACAGCGQMVPMPMDGPVPMMVAADPGAPDPLLVLMPDWGRLAPYVERYGALLAQQCRYAEVGHHLGPVPNP